MTAGRFYILSGLVMLLALAGCGRSMMQSERSSWRYQAEARCMQSGSVKLDAGVVQVKPIQGPGMCGAEFPLKVSALGEMTRLGYSDIPRPPGNIGNASQMPAWPRQAQYFDPEPLQDTRPAQLGRTPGAPEIGSPQTTAPQGYEPRSGAAPRRSDIPDDAILPQGASAQQRMPSSYNARAYEPRRQQQQRTAPPALGPARRQASTGFIVPAAVTPAATLSCPLVSALERWVSDGVQPAAIHWFGAQVTEIKQISAYSCRQMNGAGGRGISEHSFGNALDVAGFVLADGRKIMVKDGWRGTPEEQGFLHDVQLFACQTFVTVLAPGYNAAHYNHFHVDLQRRKNGRRPCRPDAIRGEVVAAKARAVYASKHGGPSYTGSIAEPAKDNLPLAVPGADGLADEDGDDIVTGSIFTFSNGPKAAIPGTDDDTTGSIGDGATSSGWPRFAPQTSSGAVH